MDDQEKRIESVFPKRIDDISIRLQTLKIYKKYLDKKLEFPVKLTGREAFKWEGFYVFGSGEKKEYEELKKTRHSYKDNYNLIRIDEHIEEDYGLFAKVTRITDKKRFLLPLAHLKAVDEQSKNCMLFDDYSVWFVNY